MRELSFRGKDFSIPLIQGGMGVGVSLGNLAGHVAHLGGMGVISTAIIGFREENFWKKSREKNIVALRKEIRKAKEIACGNGLIAINLMVCTTNYEEMAKTAVEENVDAIISGAGLPLSLPKYTTGTAVGAVPIVSSSRAAGALCKKWDRNYQCVPDFIIIEGPNAGGHLGFNEEELELKEAKSLDVLLPEVLNALEPYMLKYKKKIPVFVAGGIKNAQDMNKYVLMGASGAQIATPFIATEECDATLSYKMQYIKAKSSDLQIIKSPVGLPGRAIRNTFTESMVAQENIAVPGCIHCIHTCHSTSTPYCISRALIRAVEGDTEKGLFFSGTGVDDIHEISTVKQVVNRFLEGEEIE